jgi:mono/diheme cytochrome c family protein
VTTKPHPAAVVTAVAATYGYFLIFAEFALLELVQAGGLEGKALQTVMAGLVLGGVTGGVLAAWCYRPDGYGRALAAGFGGCALGAGLALVVPATEFTLVAGLIGLSLGWLTVTLAAGLRGLLGPSRMGLWIGLGTGLGYALCNVPAVFEADPSTQTLVAIFLAMLGFVIVRRWRSESVIPETSAPYRPLGRVRWLLMLLVLVWLDSAAFYVIQHSPTIRQVTWSGHELLWANAGMHLVAALAAGWLLDRGWMTRVLPLAFALLWLACWRLGYGKLSGVSLLYTAAVSLYSTVLVFYPAQSGRPWLTAAVYAVAGWLGSALGVGMAQDIHWVPDWFLITAAAAFGCLWLWRGGTGRALALGLVALLMMPRGRADERAWIAQGREVYVREGCIHCHSQYVRPDTRDEVRWGPVVPLTEVLAGSPPLPGNRRQGPDLANVGLRRSPAWNRLHLEDPAAVTPGSRMPAYAHLFRGDSSAGDALVAYLATLGSEHPEAARAAQAAWAPAVTALPDATESRRLFGQLCANCHGGAGRGDGPLLARLNQRPPDFTRDPWRQVRADDPALTVRLARLIKFGLPGTVMAGHEYLSDPAVVSLARYVQTLHGGPRP